MRKFPKLRSSAPWLRIVALGLAAGSLGGCVKLGKRDAFPVASRAPGPTTLPALAGKGNEIRPLGITVHGRRVTAYYARHPGARGVLILFGGSGNEVEAPLKVLGPRTESLGLDLVVFSYYQEGEGVPSVAQVREEARAICAAVRAMRTPASRSIYLVGYSLGGWFALDVVGSENVSGLALVGAETTPAEVIRKVDAPWANLIAIRPDDDARQLDASLYAPRVRSRTLVVTSRQDEAVPASVGQEIYAMIPAATPKRLVVLDGVTHGRYFLSDEFWRQFASFFGLRPE